jgi:hypothetical protein
MDGTQKHINLDLKDIHLSYERNLHTKLFIQLAKSMELSPSSEAASCLANQDFPTFYGT